MEPLPTLEDQILKIVDSCCTGLCSLKSEEMKKAKVKFEISQKTKKFLTTSLVNLTHQILEEIDDLDTGGTVYAEDVITALKFLDFQTQGIVLPLRCLLAQNKSGSQSEKEENRKNIEKDIAEFEP
jgi:hypothetical protein